MQLTSIRIICWSSLILLLCGITATASAAPVTVQLPDQTRYYYWVRGEAGSVVLPPHAITGASSFKIDPDRLGARNGGVLYVLDSHTGGVAATTLSTSVHTISVRVDDFHPVVAPAAPATVISAAPVVPKAAKSNSVMDGVGQVVTFVLGLAVLAAVIWFVRQLLLTRGRLLIDLARRLGIDVPDPADLPSPENRVDGKYEPPAPRPIERVPDDAGAPVGTQSPRGSARLVANDGTAHALGRPISTIGRDAGCDIALAGNGISRKHAQVNRDAAGAYTISDQGSANGLYVNGDRVGSAPLRSGDLIRIGDVQLRFEE